MHCDYCSREIVSWITIVCRICLDIFTCCKECASNHDSDLCLDCEAKSEDVSKCDFPNDPSYYYDGLH